MNNPFVDWVARVPVRVQTKLLAAFSAMVALLIALGAVGLDVLNGVNNGTNELIKLERKIAAYRQVQHDTSSQLYRVSAALFAADARTLDSTLRQLNQFGYDLERLEFVAADEIELLTGVRQAYEDFVGVVTRLVELIGAGSIREAHEAQQKQAQPLADRLERLTNQLVNKAEADMVAGIDQNKAAYRTSQAIVAGFAIASIMLALLLGGTISRTLVGPLHEIGTRLSDIAEGNFSQRVTVPNRDELGVLAANVNRTSERLGSLYTDLRTEQARSEALLLNTLPRPILERLRRGETVIADRIAEATILFSDIVDFTALAARLPPERMIELLGSLFAQFDALAAGFGLEKIKTLGDGYMVAAGVPEARPDHAAAAARMALAMRTATAETATAPDGPIRLRIGLHSGPLVAGVIGTAKYVYDVWGDTVNIASRMEKLGAPGRIHISAATRAALGDNFAFEPRGGIFVKGKGTMETYFLDAKSRRSLSPGRSVCMPSSPGERSGF
jgi:class 3 adenylate cyclase/CHASE3 domain sensor protein